MCETDDRPGVSLSQLFSIAGGASSDWVLKHCAVSDVHWKFVLFRLRYMTLEIARSLIIILCKDDVRIVCKDCMMF